MFDFGISLNSTSLYAKPTRQEAVTNCYKLIRAYRILVLDMLVAGSKAEQHPNGNPEKCRWSILNLFVCCYQMVQCCHFNISYFITSARGSSKLCLYSYGVSWASSWPLDTLVGIDKPEMSFSPRSNFFLQCEVECELFLVAGLQGVTALLFILPVSAPESKCQPWNTNIACRLTTTEMASHATHTHTHTHTHSDMYVILFTDQMPNFG